MARLKNISANLAAFLDMLAWSEGTSTTKGSDDGYNVIVGRTLFDSYKDHPRVSVSLPKLKIKSTAAGRYQLLSRYYDAYKKTLRLPDFSPESQDLIAIQQIRECRALPLIESGQIQLAITACARIWASLPGNSYGQHQHKAENLQAQFASAGGKLYA